MITPEQHAKIRRLYFGEHWKVGTIVAHLGVHPDTVRAAIALDTRVVRRGACRRSILDPWDGFPRSPGARSDLSRNVDGDHARMTSALAPAGFTSDRP